VVVHDFDVIGIRVSPSKANPPLVVDSNAVLASPIASQGFEAITGRHPEVLKRHRGVQHQQLASRYSFDIPKLRHVVIEE
jgi:hypothetical protein